jgi:hypothetical protein
MSLCNHEILDENAGHKIKGGNIEIIDLLPDSEI